MKPSYSSDRDLKVAIEASLTCFVDDFHVDELTRAYQDRWGLTNIAYAEPLVYWQLVADHAKSQADQ